MKKTDREYALEIAQRVQSAGGRAYYVGGCVRDGLMGTVCKDIDLEIHGILPEKLEQLLSELGEVTTMGASFGVYGLKHTALDIAMPRKETATGRGHRDFRVDVDPFLGPEAAERRRDFTINALMQDVLTGELLDCFGGQADLKNGILRHVDDRHFGEDPLRVLRAAQFSARFGFEIAEDTMQLCAKMDLSALPPERVLGELEKALLKAEHPSGFFKALRSMNQLKDWFPELIPLIGTEQEPSFHPEGDVWNHTMLVVDAAAALRNRAQYPLAFMLAALCHDLGKPAATTVSDGRIRAIGHEAAGAPLAEKLVSRLSSEKQLKAYVPNMTLLHMHPNLMAGQNSGKKAFAKLFDQSVCPEDLLLLSKADRLGQCLNAADYEQTEAFLQQRLREYHEVMAKPYVTGADLIAAGLKPDVYFKDALAFAHKLRLSGVPKELALRQTLGYIRSELLK